ncbi:phosphatase PAP2 family protein [Tengunoibacter tsumagoiensis]|uniref:Phosphatidic acid phosphatase type 2/haloperoxidase domain-containing protein n=1 Tax=Tengunoibacter tsumagoiensis TaxID=2014871 RepID=A0A401ZZZ1_9CHLR|nr:phosphatase PAP2 family protein [Tengunoibacter tsumagoiensis]GCE12351.1 hypothetical protein KTT_22100 [Tengunoibacter tsumagoiensis]
MQNVTHPKSIQKPTSSTTAGGEDRQDAQRRHRIEVPIWWTVLCVFLISCVVIRFHPDPYPVDLEATHFAQGFRPWPWFWSVVNFPSTLNDPIPSAINLVGWSLFMVLMGLIFWLRKHSPLVWLQSGIFLILTVMSSAGLNVVLDELIARPRPDPHKYAIHLYTPLVPFPTYPSGHTEHDIAFYGFLLYLSCLKAVREWRYRWLLLPLQIYAVFDILMIGYSRIVEGDHWFTDVMGGYVEGAIYLFFFIFLYRWTTTKLAERRSHQKLIAH